MTRPSHRALGLLAICGAILCFSVSSSIVKKAETPGAVIAFWRMLASVVVWQAALLAQGKRTTLANLRQVLVPGILFGGNLAIFFTAVTRTSIAHAEFIGAMTPLVLVPAGAVLFGEAIATRALGWGAIAVGGMAVVLFAGPDNGIATWQGDALVLVAMASWATYLLTMKRARVGMDVVELMAAIVPIAALTLVPVVIIRGGVTDVPARGWWAIALLTVLTGTIAHGLIVFAQRTVPVGTIGIMQVAQPALAVVWAFLLLGEEIRPPQLAGMAMVISGLALFTVVSQRVASRSTTGSSQDRRAERVAAASDP